MGNDDKAACKMNGFSVSCSLSQLPDTALGRTLCYLRALGSEQDIKVLCQGTGSEQGIKVLSQGNGV